MGVVVVLVEFVEGAEVATTALAVGMSRALNVMLDEGLVGKEVFVAGIAAVMLARVIFMLPERAVVCEPAVAAFTISHFWCVDSRLVREIKLRMRGGWIVEERGARRDSRGRSHPQRIM